MARIAIALALVAALALLLVLLLRFSRNESTAVVAGAAGADTPSESPVLLREGPRALGAGPEDPVGLTREAQVSSESTPEEPATVAYSIHGTLRVEDGGPFEPWSAMVLATDGAGTRIHSDAETGTYSIGDLHAGTWRVALNATEFEADDSHVTLTVDVPIQEVDLIVRRKPIIAVAILNEFGEAFIASRNADDPQIGALLVVATRQQPISPVEGMMGYSPNERRGIGAWWTYGPLTSRLTEPFSSVVVLQESPPAFVSLIYGRQVMDSVPISPGDTQVMLRTSMDELRATLARARVRVVDAESGLPLAAEVKLGPAGERNKRGVTCDEGGLAILFDLYAGSSVLDVQLEGYGALRRTFDLQAGVDNDLGEIELARAVEMRGRLVSPDGVPVIALAQLWPADPQGQRRAENAPALQLQIDSEGRFKARVAPGNYLLRVQPDSEISFPGRSYETPWVSGLVPLAARAGDEREVLITLRPACVLVVDPGSFGDRKDLRFRVEDEHGRVALRSRFWFGDVQPMKLPGGDYTLFLLDSSGIELARQATALTPIGGTLRF